MKQTHPKSLLALHQTAATRRITDALYLLCIQPTLQVSPESLICSLAISVSSNEMSGDSLTFTARLLEKKSSLLTARLVSLSFQLSSVHSKLHDCMVAALVALGPETFLKFLPLNVEAQDLSDANVWLFPILKQNIAGAQLSFFNESLLDTVRVLKLKSAKHEQQGRIHSARSIDELVYSIWSFLPSFCNYPLDTDESFKDLEKALCHNLVQGKHHTQNGSVLY